ncbi:alpha/beta hydrolase [Candidatus Magnetaquicoccus inordinatus]|uniref:alpha/beta hydrolase n=1 Tax=Candidatus Magnetaquicoccus inordinatus TaxID=2496818 RepID=UPI00102C88E4|nr:alpha/beta hydrolase [Candidatus Magnetaquicoccus inordinatus]
MSGKNATLFWFSHGRVLALLLLLLANGCSSRLEHARQLAESGQMREQKLQTRHFTLQSYVRLQSGEPLLVVYIEGDGAAWITENRLSDDPTPKQALALQLAIADHSPSVAYLARPCQFVQEAERKNCSPHYWSTARYAPEVVQALQEGIEQLQRQTGATRLRLVGYSGGGSLAILLARALQPERLVTVAAPLDTAAWTAWHQHTPLAQSRNPAESLPEIAQIRQSHWVGGKDKVVPKELSQQILAQQTDSLRQSLIEQKDFTHYCCWASAWPEMLQRMGW